MAVAAQAALLDELMGKRRNVSLSEARPPHWSDEDMCKYFLAGLCPHDLFNNTKDDLGPCEKVHDDSIFLSYKKSKRHGQAGYEEQLCSYLRKLISTVESRIRRGENRLQRNGNLVHSFYNSEREEVLKELTGKIDETLSKVEKLGTLGEVEQSRKWLEVAEKLKNEKNQLEKNIETYNQQAKELEICHTCGAFQVKGDAHQRIEEHLQGKMHLGYAQIREYLALQIVDKDKTNKDHNRKRSKSVKKEQLEKCKTTSSTDIVQNVKTNKERIENKESCDEKCNKNEDGEFSTEWNREQCKVKERHRDHSKGRKRRRSSSKSIHHSVLKYSRKKYDSPKHVSRHSNSRRRSRSGKRFSRH